jgi:hypothetical protein
MIRLIKNSDGKIRENPVMNMSLPELILGDFTGAFSDRTII